LFAAIITFLVCSVAAAQTDLHISGPQTGFPIAVPRLCDEADSKDSASLIPEVIGRNLQFSGLFNVLNQDSYVESPGKCIAPDQVVFSDWSVIGAEGLVRGTIKGRDSKGQLEVEMYLYDVLRQSAVVGKRYYAAPGELRRVADRFSNEVVKFFTGSDGVFGSKLAFVGKTGRFKELFTIELDGTGLRQLTRDRGLVVSPAWGADGESLLYTSYKSREPQLYLLGRNQGGSKQLTRRSGLIIGALFAPDGGSIIASAAVNGVMKLIELDHGGKLIKRLTHSGAIDVSPSFSPDGSKIVFCSNRSGGPQIYVMNRDGSGVRRISFTDSRYCTSPEWSPVDDKIVYVCRNSGNQLYLGRANGRKSVQMTFSGNNEDPVWSPDGRYLAFATDFARANIKNIAIMSVSTGRVKQLTFSKSGYTQPAWSPVLE
jgi:TolB protein